MSAVDRALAARLGKFLVVGGTGVVLNTAALIALYQTLRLPLVIASALAATPAVANNFVLNDRWTFGRRTPSLGRFGRFGVVSLGGLLVGTVVLWVLVTYLSVQYPVANLIGIALGTGVNLVGNLAWTWSRGSDR